jgi:hypothetical protein
MARNDQRSFERLVRLGDVATTVPSYGDAVWASRRRSIMYVVVHHRFIDPAAAFGRGEPLLRNEGAPPGVRGLQFYPSADRSRATCLWEADSVASVQQYVDTTLGDTSQNTCYEVDAEHAFARQPLGLPESAPLPA